jgi:hypothetical protein
MSFNFKLLWNIQFPFLLDPMVVESPQTYREVFLP